MKNSPTSKRYSLTFKKNGTNSPTFAECRQIYPLHPVSTHPLAEGVFGEDGIFLMTRLYQAQQARVTEVVDCVFLASRYTLPQTKRGESLLHHRIDVVSVNANV